MHTHTFSEWFQKWFLGSVPYSNLEKKELPYLIIAVWKIFTASAHSWIWLWVMGKVESNQSFPAWELQNL